MNAIDRLEAAREWLIARPSLALKLLPSAAQTPPPLRAELYFTEAEALRAMGYFERAEFLYAKALRSKALTDDPVIAIQALLGSAAGLRSVGQVRAASQRLAAARRTARTAGLRVYRSDFDLEEALIERASGQYGRCLPKLRRLLRAAVKNKSWSAASFIFWAIGGAERFRGKLADSEKAYLRSRAMARRGNDPGAAGYAEFGLGGVTRVRGKLTEAARHYGRAAKIFRGSDDAFARAYAECGYANALRQLGELTKAEDHYRRSHKIYSALGDTLDLAYVDWGLGQIRLLQGRPRQAAQFIRRALSAFKKGREDRGIVLAHKSLSEALHAVGRTSEAEVHFESAFARARKTGLHAHLERYT